MSLIPERHYYKILWIAIGCCLVPSMGAGVSVWELVPFILAIGCMFVLLVEGRAVGSLPPEMLLVIAAGLLAGVSISNRNFAQFRVDALPMMMFSLSAIASFFVVRWNFRWVTLGVYVFVLLSVLRDMALDLLGWGQAGYAFQNSPWSLGQRGLNTSLNPFALFLAVASLWLVYERGLLWKAAGIGGMAVGFFAAVVMGQTRAAALLIVAGWILVTLNQTPARLLVAGFLFLLGGVLVIEIIGFDPILEMFAGILARFSQIRDIEEIDRFQHLLLGLSEWGRYGAWELLFGTPADGTQDYFGVANIHNGYLQYFLRLGVLVGACNLLLWLVCAVRGGRILMSRSGRGDFSKIFATLVILAAVANLSAGIFNDWRNALIYGVIVAMWVNMSSVASRQWLMSNNE